MITSVPTQVQNAIGPIAPVVRHEGACSPSAGQGVGVGWRDVVGAGLPWGLVVGDVAVRGANARGGRRHAGRELARRARSLLMDETVATSTSRAVPRRTSSRAVAANLVATWLIFSKRRRICRQHG